MVDPEITHTTRFSILTAQAENSMIHLLFCMVKDSNVARDPLQPQQCAKLLAALAAPERLRIVRYLKDGPRNVTEIAEMLATQLVNVSHHMNVLNAAGLVQREKRGRFVLYSLTPGVLESTPDPDCGDHLNLGCCRLEMPVKKSPGDPSS